MKTFNTLRGFLTGHEKNEEIYFAYSASLRIFGENLDLEGITIRMGLQPTLQYKKGEKRKPSSPPYKIDCWLYSPALNENVHLSEHISVLWRDIKINKDYLIKLKETATVDIFLGYRSNCDHAGLELPYQCLEIFTELKIPFGISIITA